MISRIDYETIIRILLEKIQSLETAATHYTGDDLGKIDFAVLPGKNQGDIDRLKLFMEIFHALSAPDNADVPEENLISELTHTGRFNLELAKTYINKALQNGQIYERMSGVYSKP
jgi:replicative DNA helicase Mcm